MPATISECTHRCRPEFTSHGFPAQAMAPADLFDDSIRRYLRMFPDCSRSPDSDWHRFEAWLPPVVPALERQQLLLWLASLTTVERHAARLRFTSLRFESLARTNLPSTFDRLGSRRILIHLNPSYVCARRDLPVDSSGERQTATVLVFTWQGEVRTALLSQLAVAVIKSLANGPKSLSILEQQVERGTVGNLRELLHDFVSQRILAVTCSP